MLSANDIERAYGFLGDYAVQLSLTIGAIVLVADLITPLGVASGVPYSLAILLALNSQSRRYILTFALLCSLCTIAALFFGPGRGGSELWKVFVNRFLALCMIWITLSLGLMRKRAERQRREAEELMRLHLADLAHMSRVKTAGTLATTLAHELNQPLAAISMQSEVATKLVEKIAHPDPLLVESLNEVTDQSHRVAAIIRGMRNFVRKSDPPQRLVHLGEVVRGMTPLIDPQFERVSVELCLQLDDVPPILGDPVQLEQVLFNLLQNSLEAVEEANASPRRVIVEVTSSNRRGVLLSVHDTGIGLSSGNAEQLFERFYSSKPKGMGMGLAISRSIVEAHGGKLWAEPNAFGGATFRINLPMAA